jgi:hypothetical protein
MKYYNRATRHHGPLARTEILMQPIKKFWVRGLACTTDARNPARAAKHFDKTPWQST